MHKESARKFNAGSQHERDRQMSSQKKNRLIYFSQQEEFVIEKSKEAWDRGARWQEKACMILSEGNIVELQFIYVVMLCDYFCDGPAPV